jgi:hypothetical protein
VAARNGDGDFGTIDSMTKNKPSRQVIQLLDIFLDICFQKMPYLHEKSQKASITARSN